jgi:hypothetical protein
MNHINSVKQLLLSCARIAEMLFLILFYRKQEGCFLQICKMEIKISLVLVLSTPLIFLGAIAIIIEYIYVLKHWER